MPDSLLIGSANADKAQEVADLLEGLPWRLERIPADGSIVAPIEDGRTFAENAVLKARHYAAVRSLPCVADDSGLMVDALDGAPGIYSARFAGVECNYEDNNRKLLELLENKLWHERTARFVCCAALVFPDGRSHVEEGVVEGHIAVEPLGKNGFGYDPLFVPLGSQQTFAEMTTEEKHKLSHRARAFMKLRSYLETLQ